MKLDGKGTGSITEHLASVFFGYGQNVAVLRRFQHALAMKNACGKTFRKIVQQQIALAHWRQLDIGNSGLASLRIVSDGSTQGMRHELVAVTDPEKRDVERHRLANPIGGFFAPCFPVGHHAPGTGNDGGGDRRGFGQFFTKIRPDDVGFFADFGKRGQKPSGRLSAAGGNGIRGCSRFDDQDRHFCFLKRCSVIVVPNGFEMDTVPCRIAWLIHFFIMIDSELTIRKLEIFLAFMEKKNIARTAESLGISSVSVHRALHSLEEVLRCPLYAPEGRNLRPLPAAQTLAHYAGEVLMVTRQAIVATRQAAGYGSGRMKLGCLYSLTLEIVPKLIMGLKRRRPEMEIDLTMNSNQNLLAGLEEGQLDAALISVSDKKAELSGLEVLPLFEDDIYFAMPVSAVRPLADTVDLADFAHEKFVTLNEGFATAESFRQAFDVAGFEPEVVTRLNDVFSLMNLVQAGVGCSLVPKRVKKVFENSVRLLPLAEKYQKSQTVALVFPKTRERDPDMLALVAEARMIVRQVEN